MICVSDGTKSLINNINSINDDELYSGSQHHLEAFYRVLKLDAELERYTNINKSYKIAEIKY